MASYAPGGVELRFEVAGEIQLHERMEGMVAQLDDWTPALERIAASFQRHMEQVFSGSGTGTAGGAWKALSPAYADWKSRHYPGAPILTRKGTVRAALSREGAEGAIRDLGSQHLTLGSGVRTPNGKWNLAMIHHQGRKDGTLPARPIIDITDTLRTEWMSEVRELMSWEKR